jgi:RNA-binding protein
MALTGQQNRYLRGLAHHLKPTATVGKLGITETLIQQIQQNLTAHELVKVKLGISRGPERQDEAKALATGTGAMLVQVLGGIVILYKPHPKKPKIKLPKEKS